MGFTRRKFPQPSNEKKTPDEQLEDTVYIYLLSENPWAFGIACTFAALQATVLAVFWYYRKEDEEWEKEDTTTPFGKALMFLILFVFTWPDITRGLQLASCVRESWCPFPFCCRGFGWIWSNFRVWFAGMVVANLANMTLWTAGVYTWSTGASDTELLMNIVAILYVMDMDENAHGLVQNLCPLWHIEVIEDIKNKYTLSPDNQVEA